MANFNFNEKMQDFACEKKRIQNKADIACKRIQLEADMKKQTVADQTRRDLAKLNRQMDEFHQKYREWRKEQWELSHAEAVPCITEEK